jgi:IPT/TIG domain
VKKQFWQIIAVRNATVFAFAVVIFLRLAPVTAGAQVPSSTITALYPNTAAAGGPAFTLTVNGSGFTSAAVVKWNGAALPTTFINASQLAASVPAYLIAPVLTTYYSYTPPPQVTVAIGGVNSNSMEFFVGITGPRISLLNPSSTTAGSPAFTLIVNGSGFNDGADIVKWNGMPLDTVFNSESQLAASVPASLVAAPGTAQVTVVVPGDTGSYLFDVNSNAADFQVVSTLTIAALSPSTAPAGGSGFTLTVNGSGFASAAFVVWNGKPLKTTVVNGGQLTATVEANLIATPGTAQVAVEQGEGKISSNSLPFTTLAPPTIASINPNRATAGGPAFGLTLNGIWFGTGAVVVLNGTALSTTRVNGNQLIATVPANLITTAGTLQVIVIQPGISSNSVQFTITAPPTITSLDPNPAIAGGPAFTLTVYGAGFASGDGVRWNETQLSTTFVNETQLTASVPANLIATPGTAQVTVVEPGITSNSVPFTIAPPTITSLKPDTATAGGPAFTLTVNGTGFANGAAVRWNETPLSTTFVNPTQLTASVPANLIATAGTAQVAVVGAGIRSNSVVFTITVSPTIASLNPNTANAGGSSFTLTVNGTGFANGAVVQWNETPLSTTFVNATQLTASVPANLIAAAGTAEVVVVEQGITSNSLRFTITAPALMITALDPNAVSAGGPAFTLTVNGTGFASGAAVQWNGTPLSTTFVNATQLTASVPANLTATVGTAQVTVVEQGITSNSQRFTITAQDVTITSLNPNAVSAGGPAFTLTVNGTGFADGAVVQWSGTPLSTTLVSATRLTASVPVDLIANQGTVQVTVLQGVTSNFATLAIVLPPPLVQTGIFEVHIRAADGTSETTANTQNFVLEIGLTVAVAANVQPVRSLIVNFLPAAPGRLTGATNTLDIQGLVDDFVSRTNLTSLHLDLPITVIGSLIDVAGAELALVTKTNETLPSCTAEIRDSRIINDACLNR